MLRCCQLTLRFRINYGTKNVFIPQLSLDVMTRRVSYATKFNLRDESSKCAEPPNNNGRTGSGSMVHARAVYLNTHDLVHITSAEPPGLDNGLPLPLDARSTRIAGAWSLEGCVDHPLPLEENSPQLRLLAINSSFTSTPSSCTGLILGSFATFRRTVKHLQHHVQYASMTTGTASPEDPPAAPVVPTPCTALAHAVELVQDLLNGAPVSSQRLDATVLVSIFHELGSDLLRRLSAKHRGELLCLFGSISDDRNARQYHSRYKNQIRGISRGQTHWEEVIRVAREMEELGQVFGERENYWSMRAYLERLKSTDCVASQKMAKLYFSRIPSRAQHAPSVLLPYLDVFLALPSTPGFGDALSILCSTITKQSNPQRNLIHLFWKVILANGTALPASYKSNLLDTLLSRISNFRGTVPGIVSVNVTDLVMAFAAAFFPCYRKSDLPAPVSLWVMDCVRASLAEGVPMDERFSNLGLLSMFLLPKEHSASLVVEKASTNLEWRTLIGIAILERSLSSQTVASPFRAGGIQDIGRSLWHSWRNCAVVDRPREVNRAVAITFLQIAAKIKDDHLLEGCMEFISSYRLWVAPEGSESETGQVERLFCAFAGGLFVRRVQTYMKLLPMLEDSSHSSLQRTRYLHSVFLHLAQRDVELAHQFYLDCLSRDIPVSPDASFPVVQHLAFQQKWADVIPFLQNHRLKGSQIEEVLDTVLSVFRDTRQESTAPVFAGAVGDALWRFYSATLVPDRLKYPIRFFLPIMISSHRPQQAVQLLEALARNNPVIFTPRYFLRIIHSLLLHRQHALVVKVFELASTSFQEKPRVVIDLRRKTVRGLMRAGAFKLASRVESTGPHGPPRTPRDQLLDRIPRRSSQLRKWALLRLVSTMTVPPVRGSKILSAVQILVQNRCFALARRLIKQSFSGLTGEDLTAIGNVYLHGPLRHWNMRNGRLIRHALRTKDFLVQQYGFVPDRVTVNIVIKAMLRWRTFMNSRMVRSLFDHLIRNGYPASEQWHTANGVPFGTPSGAITFDLSNVRSNMSFKRHVRPLYKMFIKEMFLRKDPRAARRVIGILKEQEVLAMRQKEHREQARRAGIIKKQRKRALARSKSGGGELGE